MPDPIVVLDPREQEWDFLFDVRTGYLVNFKEPGHYDLHPYGEGDQEIFHVLRAKRKDVPKQWTAFDNEGNRSRVRKLDLSHFMANAMPTKRVKSGLLANVYSFKARFVAGSDEDFKTERSKYDDRKNAVRTVGTGYTFATIQASINAGASGDVSAVYGNGGTPLVSGDYNENIVDNALNNYQLIGMLESGEMLPAIRIWNAAGNIITIDNNEGWLIENFDVDGDGTAANGLSLVGGYQSWIKRIVAHDVTLDGFVSNLSGVIANCCAYNCGSDGFQAANATGTSHVHCTAVDCVGVGFRGSALDRIVTQGCLASDNGVDYQNVDVSRGGWNVSSDLTAPGAGARTGFNNANFINYAGDDFRLAAAGENGANIDGWPLLDVDINLNTREKNTLLFYAGFHDPYVPPMGGTPTCLGIIDASPAAQGSIWVRWFEGCFTGAVIPYRYDFHVKRFDEGLLTPAEINAGTYYARSLTADELLGCGGSGLSGNGPGVLQALLAFESPGDITLSVIPNDENMHLFTNRQYWIAVRCIGIDPATNIIYEDDNVLSILSYSSGHQGELWTSIINWPCLELCAGNPTQDIHVDGSVDATITNLPDPLNMKLDADLPTIEVQPLDITVRGGDYPPAGQPGGGPAGG